MPGRTPGEAYRAFIEPIEAAVACLGVAKVVPSPGGRSDTTKDHSWTLNGLGKGMVFRDGYCFRASMGYRFIPHEDGWRVTTLNYIYSLSRGDRELWGIHWHPVGKSPERRTHLHTAIDEAGDAHVHRPMGRFAFEDAVEWVIGSGVPAAIEEWPAVLTKSKTVYVRHRTWDDWPVAR